MANEQQLRENLRWVTAELHRTRGELATAQRSGADPVAVVGMACRFPGGLDSPELLWQSVVDGVDSVGALPADRGWDLDALHDPEPGRPGTVYTAAGGFLTGIDRFDAGFFGISPREAEAMDPQHRLLLETSWEALEAAGLDIDALRGSRTGVFVGAAGGDYRDVARAPGGDVDGHLLTGNAASVASGRIAYTFGLEGPAVTLDTACSSSLVALHLAAQSLRRSECGLALAAGVTVLSTPTVLVELARQQVLAPDGRCRAYSADAAGMGWGEGVGVLVLERLADARRNGHRVLAVLRGSAVNQDGASNGLSAPSGPAQRRVIAAALADAGLTAAQVDVVEGHGTGTRLGDPIELGALLETYGRDREGEPLLLGTVKSNLGHTQAAAGIAGVIKMVEAVRHGIAPMTLHAGEPTDRVDWAAGAVRLLTETRPWPEVDRPRRAGVSAFGISGTNAHVIVEQDVPDPAQAPDPAPPAPLHSELLPLVLSAGDDAALRARAGDIAALTGHALADIGFSLATGASLPRRAVVLADGADGFRAGLGAVGAGDPGTGVVRGTAGPPGGVVFVFPGQGTQWPGMAAGLLESAPVFRDRFAECERALAEFIDFSPAAVLRGEPGTPELDRIEVVQPVLFAVMVSLARLWESFGLRPAAVIGHSQGEVAAACVAGALSLPDAARVVGVRAGLWARLVGKGIVASVALPLERVEERLARFTGVLSVAAVNSRAGIAVSGERTAMTELLAELAADGIRTNVLRIDVAAHSPQVDALRAELLAALAPVAPVASEIPFYSTVSGGAIDTKGMDAEYWFRNMRQPVLFEPAVRALLAAGYPAFLELGPHPALGPAIAETAETADTRVTMLASLRRDEGGAERFLTALAEAFVTGVEVDWAPLFAARGATRIPLPRYPFQRACHWPTAPAAAPAAATGGGAAEQGFWAAVRDGDPTALTETLGLPESAAAEWSTVLPELARWHRATTDEATVDRWRYAVRWRPLPAAVPAAPAGTWLAVLPTGAEPAGFARTVLAGLAARGAELRTLSGPGEAAAALGAGPVTGVLSFAGLDDEPAPGDQELAAGAVATLELARAVAGAAGGARLWCVTRGAVAIGPSDRLSAPRQAALWGLGLVAALELPDRWGGLVDLPAAVDERGLDRLAALLAAPGAEDQFALRQPGVFVRRMVRADRPRTAPRSPARRPRGTVLVTGGTGGIAAHVARELAAAGAAHLVLVSRGGQAADGAAELAAELENAGVTVTVAACDVADRAALAALLDRVPPVNAVLHLAGVPQNQPLATLTAAEFAAAYAAKAAGTRNLDELLAGTPLDAFVVFSSGAAVWGSAGQAAYAAANAEAEAVVLARRQRGEPGIAIAWGGWAGGGMVDDAAADRARRLGIGLMAPELALRALWETIDDDALRTIAELDWPRFAPAFTGARPSPLIGEIAEAAAALRERAPGVEAESLLPELAGLTGVERHAALLARVCAEVAEVLGHGSAAAIAPDLAFKDLGFDSLTAVELRNRLSAALGLRLPATLVFDHPTPESVVRHLLGELPGAALPAPAPAATGEPLAVIGMACRFPGDVASPDELWRLLLDGVDTVGPFPADRGWDLDNLYDPDGTRPGTSYVREGAFLGDAGGFDAEFFGISPREAAAMDPQQRLLLETAWEGLEHAGIAPDSLRGSDTGVFVGGASQDFAAQLAATPAATDGYALTGSAGAVMSGRIAYQLGLEGPAVTVDTACSSSLVALHLAGQALRRGECSLALTGAVAVLASPAGFVEFSRQGGLARDGRCRPFDRAASGTAWGEGVGFLVLERLSDAERNGHRVLALLRGSAVNSDGASNGLTAPNGPSQQRVITKALADAGLTAAEIDVVEAHGTATTLGDPIEAQALLATYGRDREQPLLLGSMKANIGHTQAAAGIAGVIKTVLALRHGVVPGTVHLTEPTPEVDWSSGAVLPVAANTAWPETGRPRRAGVSAFGVSGTNAHVIVEEYQEPTTEPVDRGTPLVPWLISGHTDEALRTVARELAEHRAADPLDVAAALAVGRAQLGHRAAILGRTGAELRAGLAAVAAGGSAAGAHTGVAVRGRLVLLFPGQGTQRLGAGAELYDRYPVFADAFDEVCAHLDPLLELPLRTVAFTHPDALERTAYAQPALFALAVALYRLFEHWGVRPDAVLGHSVGELAAAHVAGVLSLSDAAAMVAARGALMERLPADGAMLAVRASEERTRELAADRLEVAAVNGPESVVLTGPADTVAELEGEFTAAGIRARRLRVAHAFHSAAVEPMLAEYAARCAAVDCAAPRIPLYAAVTGDSTPETSTPGYWVRNVRETVRFADAVRAAAGTGEVTFLELGPDGTLAALAGESTGAPAFAALRADRGEEETVLSALAAMHVRGTTVDWPAFHAGSGAVPVELPRYPFRHQHYWLPPATGAGTAAGLGFDAIPHPMLTAVAPVPETGALLFSGRLSTGTVPWLADHVIDGLALLPGSALLDIALAAGARLGGAAIDELTLEAPVPVGSGLRLQLLAAAADPEGRRHFTIHTVGEAAEDESWARVASGVLAPAAGPLPEPPAQWPPDGAEPLPMADYHERAERAGLGYGAAFRGLRAVWQRGEELFAEVTAPDGLDAGAYGLHPALLDAGLRAPTMTARDRVDERLLPFAWRGVRLHRPGSRELRLRIVTAGAGEVAITATDSAGRPVLSVDRLVSRTMSASRPPEPGAALFRLDWTPAPVPAGAGAPAAVIDFTAEPAGAGLIPAAHAATLRAADEVRSWLAGHPDGARLLVLTRGAVATAPDEDVPDLVHAPLWGLLRAVQAEHPDRITLLDTDDPAALPPLPDGEPQLAVRAGRVLVPRLVTAEPRTAAPAWDRDGTVLVTGATGGLGALVVRHLAERHGIRSFVLASRSGPAADGAAALLADLAERGADAELVACDTADRAAVAELIALVPADRPLRGVVHVAGVVADGLIDSLTPDRLAAVLRPKLDAAVHLHELTRELELSAFVLFSSSAAVFGTAGQANYAAANAFLDALAQHRRAVGLPAVAIGWGPWDSDRGMTAGLTELDLQRIRRGGLVPLTAAAGLALLDAADGAAPSVVAAWLDRARFRTGDAPVPALLRPAPATAPQPAAADPVTELLHRLAAVPADERVALLVALVRAEASAVLGHSNPAAVGADRPFTEAGIDSLASVELRNRLNAATGLRLPATLVFDFPTPSALARHMTAELVVPEPVPVEDTRLAEFDRLVAELLGAARDPGAASALEERLHTALTVVREHGAGERDGDLAAASSDELLSLIDAEFG
ncbi:type I polyketide synthase [Nocardia sp. NPDC057353]|uniref:type I polyketide synthase n=1 Tax=Nocardia sp. NPDC057353 TaxID=3346104 RepID=UPI0036309D95